MEILIILGMVAFIGWMILANRSSTNQSYKPNYQSVELSINLDIKNEKDYIEAVHKLQELNDHLPTTGPKTKPILVDAIKQLKSAMQEYRNNPNGIKIEYSTSSNYEDTDSWEGTIYEADESFGVSANIKIKYTDSKGLFSERDVTVRNAGIMNGKKAIFGYCKLRNQSRTFIINQISECIDLDTGEFIQDVYAYLQEKYNSSPEKSMDEVVNNEQDILNVWVYIARADSQYRKEEKLVICNAIRALSGDSRITDEVINKELNSYKAISIHSFKLAIGRLSSRSDEIKNLISNTAKQIVETQKTVHHAEQEALDYIDKRFQQ